VPITQVPSSSLFLLQDEGLEHTERRLHALGRHHYLGQEIFVVLEPAADLGDARGHEAGDQGACQNLGLERRTDQLDSVLVFAVDDVPFDLLEQLLDLGRRVVPAVGLARLLDIVLQVFDTNSFSVSISRGMVSNS
jgi:hypothetical protein